MKRKTIKLFTVVSIIFSILLLPNTLYADSNILNYQVSKNENGMYVEITNTSDSIVDIMANTIKIGSIEQTHIDITIPANGSIKLEENILLSEGDIITIPYITPLGNNQLVLDITIPEEETRIKLASHAMWAGLWELDIFNKLNVSENLLDFNIIGLETAEIDHWVFTDGEEVGKEFKIEIRNKALNNNIIGIVNGIIVEDPNPTFTIQPSVITQKGQNFQITYKNPNQYSDFYAIYWIGMIAGSKNSNEIHLIDPNDPIKRAVIGEKKETADEVTIILYAEYLDTLEDGKYTLVVDWYAYGGYKSDSHEIIIDRKLESIVPSKEKETVQTGDKTNITVYGIMFISILFMGLITIKKTKQRVEK